MKTKFNLSNKRSEKTGKKAGWIKLEDIYSDDPDFFPNNIRLERVGEHLVLREGDHAILSCHVSQFLTFLEQLMLNLRKDSLKQNPL